jgi:hypothetical protein
VFRNLGEGRFQNVTGQSGDAATPHSSRGAAFGDVDNDGDIDILIMNMNERPSLLRNDYAGGHHWIELRLEGTRSNRSAIGAMAIVTVGGRRQAKSVLSESSYYSHDDVRLHFGLGTHTSADTIEIRWPSGTTQVLENVAADRVLAVTEDNKLNHPQR